ncbi:NAD-dependent epimerase/dehydratase family protein [Chloroflexota bacterium]
MKTVVTGGTGFIGSHLVKRLVDEGRQVLVASEFSQLGTENLSNLGVEVECQNVDLRDYQQALSVIDGAEVVFHLAARVGSLEYLHGTEMSELVALQTNLVIDANIFRACMEKNVKKIVYASSVAVYPMPVQYSSGAVFSEDDLVLGHETQGLIDPDGGYGWTKFMGEIELGWMKGIDIGIARIFNIYGTNEPLGEKAHVVADLIRKAIRYPQEPFIVWGDGKQSRDFLYVSDCADALLKLEEKASDPPITVNVGSDKAVTIGLLAEKIVGLSGKDIEIVYDPARPMGPLSRTADTSKTKAVLRWEPKIGLDEGLRRIYAWLASRLKG